jgi:hypothetical protein
MSFDPYNCFLKIRESIRTLTPKVRSSLGSVGFISSHSHALPKLEVHLGVWGSFPHTLLHSQSWKFTWECGVHSLTLSCTPKSMKYDSRAHFWPAPLQALTLVTSSRLRLRHLWWHLPSVYYMNASKLWRWLKMLQVMPYKNKLWAILMWLWHCFRTNICFANVGGNAKFVKYDLGERHFCLWFCGLHQAQCETFV